MRSLSGKDREHDWLADTVKPGQKVGETPYIGTERSPQPLRPPPSRSGEPSGRDTGTTSLNLC